MFDVCLVGPVTTDIISINNKIVSEQIGGTVYYTGLALKALGLKIAVITTTSGADKSKLLKPFHQNDIDVYWSEGAASTVFENHYPDELNLNLREENVVSVSKPFSFKEISQVATKHIHLSFLTRADFERDFFEQLSNLASTSVSADLQGLLRVADQSGKIFPQGKKHQDNLSAVSMIKASQDEVVAYCEKRDVSVAAKGLSKEVVVTRGSKGATIYAAGAAFEIEARPVEKVVDVTGCGDTFMAGYLYQRLRGVDIKESGNFASSLAALKAKQKGALGSPLNPATITFCSRH